jgi:hypothetical protein
MLNKFWEGIGEGVAQKWLQQIGPAFFFWFGGLYLVIGWDGLKNTSKELITLDTIQQILILLIALLLLVASGTLVSNIANPILRLLEGYWTGIFQYPRNWMVNNRKKTLGKRVSRWQILKKKIDEEKATNHERNEFINLDVSLHYTPADPNDLMPTELGNILRMAEKSSFYTYGLDAVVCWPRLWPLLPDHLRQDILQARHSINRSVELCFFGIIFIVWGWASLWAIPIALLSSFVFYRLTLPNSKTYSDLVVSAFDLYRWELYKSLHIKYPDNSQKERSFGKQISEYLWRGTEPSGGWDFVDPGS